jgi:8-oxo-dGTP diphosphatase
MARTLLPASAHIVCQHGSHVLLIQRSHTLDTWPGYWSFPGGKIEDGELFRECALRETSEEVGVIADPRALKQESLVMTRTVQGTKLIYFWLLYHWENAPSILEPDLIQDMQWFPIDDLPDLFIPHHRLGLEAILAQTSYVEFDVAP